MSNVVVFDNIRTIGNASILGTYVAVGVPFPHNARVLKIINNTNGDIFFSDDGVNDKDFYPANSAGIFDFTTNRADTDDSNVLPMQFQCYVRYNVLPTTGDLWIVNLYNRGN